MKKVYIKVIYLIICISTAVNAQIDSINLPTGGDELKINRFTPIISIYVDSTNTVYIENEPITVTNIGKELSYVRYKIPFEAQIHIKIFLYIDNNVNYATVDEIKTELASAHFEMLYYKTNSIEDKDLLKGISWTNHQSFYHLEIPKKVLIKKEQERQKSFNDSINKQFVDIPQPPTNWFFDLQHIIYSDSKEALEEALEGKIYTCIMLMNKGYKKGNEILKFEEEKVENLFNSNDIVFVRFSEDLKYENYFKAVSEYKELDNKKRGFFFELSSEIEKIHGKSGIKLCD